MKNNKLLILLTLLLGASLVTNKQPVKTSAAQPMPTNINMQNATDAEVQAYYDGIDNEIGDDLLAFLNSKIKGHNEYDYESTTHRTIYKIIDRNWDLDASDPQGSADTSNFNYITDNGFIRKLYADYNDDIDTADRFKNAGASRVSFDKEHIWAQSLGDFGRDGGAGSDFHALWPSDVAGNQSAHSNYNFAVPTSSIKEYSSDKDTYVGRNGKIDGYTQKVFEPLDEFKGDIARAMFYMPARYYEWEGKLHPKLQLVNGSPNAVTASETINGLAGDLATLLEWHELDPVDEYEIRRNNLIANNYQGNRNPFIDYPQWARIAYDENYVGVGATNAAETSSVGLLSDPYKDAVLTGLTINTSKVKVNYLKGEEFDPKGLVVTAHYLHEDDELTRVVKNYTLSINMGYILDTPGAHVITISLTHGDTTETETFSINVANESLSDRLFINEIYGAGGNGGALYSHDYVELYNKGDIPIPLNGKSLQYSSPTNDAWSLRLNLSGQINAKSHYLIRLGTKDATIGEPLPQADYNGTINMGASDLKLALVNSTAKLDPLDNKEIYPHIIDLVGAGTATNYLGSKAPKPSTTESIHRRVDEITGEPINTKNNGNDFVVSNPSPLNSALSIAESLMSYSDVNDMSCLINYAPIKERVLELTPDIVDDDDPKVVTFSGQLSFFKNNNTVPLMVDGRARYEAWAFFNDDATPYEPSVVDMNERATVNNGEVAQTMIVLVISLLAMSLFVPLFIRKQPN